MVWALQTYVHVAHNRNIEHLADTFLGWILLFTANTCKYQQENFAQPKKLINDDHGICSPVQCRVWNGIETIEILQQ